MSEPKIQFPNFKDAYCAAYRCKPENFDHQVFWKCVYRRSLPLAVVMQAVMGEFDTRCRLERSIRRAVFRMRVSGARLSPLFSTLLPLIRPPSPSPVVIVPKRNPQGITAGEGPENRETRENTGMVVRRLKRFHADIVGGRPLPEALAVLGVGLDEATALLGKHRSGRPDLEWLHDHLAERGQLEWLRAENARLARQATEMSTKLSAAAVRDDR